MNQLRTILASVAALLVLAPAAAAHVTISADSLAAGSYAFVEVRVPHGCEDEPTEVLRVKMPEEIVSVTPGRNPGWTVEKVMQELDEPITGPHGEEITERVSEVVWTADEPLPSDVVDTFHMSIRWPDDAAGTTLAFPAIQECPGGAESAWVEPVIEGEDEPEMPAPTLAIGDAETAGHGNSGTDGDAATDESGDEDDDQIENAAWAGIGLGGLSLILAAAAFVRSGRRS